MPAESWQENYNKIKNLRHDLYKEFGFHAKQEMHTKQFLTDKDPYRDYKWSNEIKQEILKEFTKVISTLDISIVNVIIDKSIIKKSDYPVLEKALTYNIQRIENDSNDEWNYLIITDKGRLSPMRKTARAIRAFNPIPSQYTGSINKPVKNLIEDIMEKDSKESYFIQICDFISYFVHLYYRTRYKKESLPTRVGRLIDNNFVGSVLATFSANNILNEKASSKKYGLVIYPK
jgi:hypothetical protein